MPATDGSCMNFIAWTTVTAPVAAAAGAARAAGAAPPPPPPPKEKAVGDWLTGGAMDEPPLPSYAFRQLLSGKAIETVPARDGTTSPWPAMEMKESIWLREERENERGCKSDAKGEQSM